MALCSLRATKNVISGLISFEREETVKKELVVKLTKRWIKKKQLIINVYLEAFQMSPDVGRPLIYFSLHVFTFRVNLLHLPYPSTHIYVMNLLTLFLSDIFK